MTPAEVVNVQLAYIARDIEAFSATCAAHACVYRMPRRPPRHILRKTTQTRGRH